jgi:hypothetical protein
MGTRHLYWILAGPSFAVSGKELMKICWQILGGHGANLGQLDQQGDSTIYWAARQGHAHIIQ